MDTHRQVSAGGVSERHASIGSQLGCCTLPVPALHNRLMLLPAPIKEHYYVRSEKPPLHLVYTILVYSHLATQESHCLTGSRRLMYYVLPLIFGTRERDDISISWKLHTILQLSFSLHHNNSPLHKKELEHYTGLTSVSVSGASVHPYMQLWICVLK